MARGYRLPTAFPAVGSVGVTTWRPERRGIGDLDAVAARKIALRDQLVTAAAGGRCWRSSRAARAIAEHLLATTDLRRAATVAAYVSVGTEPGTGPLLDRLRALGRRVIVPVVLPDLDLDWAVYDGPEQPRAGPRAGCSSRPGRGSASTRSPPPTWC